MGQFIRVLQLHSFFFTTTTTTTTIIIIIIIRSVMKFLNYLFIIIIDYFKNILPE